MNPLPRSLCILLPWFRTERLDRAVAEPAAMVVVQRHSNTLLVTGVNRLAGQSGARVGQTLVQARVLDPALQVTYQDDNAELNALEAAAGTAYQFTPNIQLAPPNALLLDITGCERLFKNEDNLASKIAHTFAVLGYTPVIGIADNPTAAMALAMSATETVSVALPAHGDQPLEGLPLQALRLDRRTQKGLQDLGLSKISELLALPIEELTHRFSDDLVLRIRQLTGDVEEVFTVWHQPKLLAERLDFTGPTNRYTSLLFVLKQAATFLEQRLHSHAAGARRLEVKFHGTDGDDLEFVLDTARPTADADGIATLLISRFEKTRRGDSWFDALTITVPSHEPIAERQRNMFSKETENTSVDFLRLLDELTGRLGADSVSRAELTYSPHPRNSFRYVPFGSKPVVQEDITPNPSRPSRVDRKRMASVRTGLSKLPDWWDFSANQTALQVISGPERVAVNTPTDYFHVETPRGERHWISLSEGIWWFPYELREFRDDLVELINAARFDDEIDTSIDYAELVCVSNFSFLRGASTADDLFRTAKDKGLKALAITDLHTFAGMVRAHAAAEEHGLKLIVASRIPLTDGPDICLYVQNRLGYASLCRLLTVGKRRTTKGKCSVFLRDLKEFSGHLHCLVLNADDAPSGSVEALKSVYSDKLSLAACNHFEAHDLSRIERIEALGASLDIPLVAVNDVHLHTEEMKELQDVQTCIREFTKIDEADRFLLTNTERRIKSAQQMSALFKNNPAWIARGLGIAGSCNFSMNELRYEYPDEIVPKGQSMQEYLEQETWAGARWRYPEGVSEKVKKIILHELELISELDYSAYFLTVYDIVRHARKLNILCQGRGSAANSSVCFCLGITSVNPIKVNLLFERFISRERNEPPDIDVDFEHERREEVIQYIYEKYGRHRAGLAATVITYRFKSAVRDVGTALGFSLDQIDKLSKDHQWWDDFEAVDNSLAELGMDSQSENVQKLRRVIKQLRGYPRHLSQHVGGFVITRGRLDELVPIENAAMDNRTVIEWDKSDIEELGLLKVDCLSLGMLTACRKAFALINDAGGEQLDFVRCFDSDPEGDGSTPEAKAIYGMLHKADAIGTFQVESRAQMSMLPRLKPSRFYDLVIEVAIVRPGPIQGQMVHPYLKRRQGLEPVEYPYPPLKSVLERTCGVPLFQEQAMQVAVVAAGFTPGEADELRRAMGAWRKQGLIAAYKEKLILGMQANGIDVEYAERLFKQISGFGEYGFPESHAASFALITFVSCFLKRFYPAAFTCGLINSQPMGFYSVSSLIRDLRNHGTEVLPVSINDSDWDCQLEGDNYSRAPLDEVSKNWGKHGPALRLGMRQIRGLNKKTAEALMRARLKQGRFKTIEEVVKCLHSENAGPRLNRDLTLLAEADAFAALGLDRRTALWSIRGLAHNLPPLFAKLDDVTSKPSLPEMSEQQVMAADYNTTGLSLRAHPLSFKRTELAENGVVTIEQLRDIPHGTKVRVAGYVLMRQRPATAKGIMFFSLEDETDVANIVVWKDFLDANRKVLLGERYLIVGGKLEKDGDVIHVISEEVWPIENMPTLKQKSRDFR